ncbi:MAG: GNAT family N-acetyltransferase [bacterium]|nr:GNAT family N-acetyltransferase [bacterium]
MEIKYLPYEDRFFEDIRRITLTSFELTAFGTDGRIPREKALEIAWEAWCRPVLVSDKKKYCVMACTPRKAVGFIIYGANAEFSRLLDIKIGSIILMAVEKKYRGRYRIARHLLEYVFNIYKNNKVNLITVGTDQDNLPAVMSYIHSGFEPVLNWSTFRYYFKEDREYEDTDGTLVKTEKADIRFQSLPSRPVPYLCDNKLTRQQKNALLRYIIKKIKLEINGGRLEYYHIRKDSQTAGYLTLMRDKAISEVLRKSFYRINDLVFPGRDEDMNSRLLCSSLSALKKLHPSMDSLEIFIRSNDWPMIHILNHSGFTLVHNAMNLHCHLPML